ncbi:hypothetical protein PsYK624_123180 [Phanerochaete sordida]|uniref:Uncharacterized protein n=1 Tax=Phanerochaete sordida TaxID=48140 RepID=A0A9P3GJ77_9APHY|nr:hypothetical protein PsYK624_123180 [Phanerochaete sordida]
MHHPLLRRLHPLRHPRPCLPGEACLKALKLQALFMLLLHYSDTNGARAHLHAALQARARSLHRLSYGQ